jgi:hypothetical protein
MRGRNVISAMQPPSPRVYFVILQPVFVFAHSLHNVTRNILGNGQQNKEVFRDDMHYGRMGCFLPSLSECFVQI